jgi:hypothetical protein
MRRFALLGALAALLLPASAWGADGVTLSAQPGVVAYDGVVRFQGSAEILADVFLVQQRPAGWTVVAQTKPGRTEPSHSRFGCASPGSSRPARLCSG